MLVAGGLVAVVLIIFAYTDWRGWTTFYRWKRRPGGILSDAALGMEELFADRQKRSAIEYRTGRRQSARPGHANEKLDPL